MTDLGWGDDRAMTVTTDQLHNALLEQVDSAPQPVGDLLTQVAEAENVDVPIVASAMWDLVEDGRVVYGTDAVVSPASLDADVVEAAALSLTQSSNLTMSEAIDAVQRVRGYAPVTAVEPRCPHVAGYDVHDDGSAVFITCKVCGCYLPEQPPLVCALCFARRWNDGSVRWLPLAGSYREPYCAVPCATLVMTGREARRNGGLDVWLAMQDLDAEMVIR